MRFHPSSNNYHIPDEAVRNGNQLAKGCTMRFGYWMPIFGGWLRNVEDEAMPTSWDYIRRLTQRSEKIGFDLTLVAELNLNDIKGEAAPSLDAWSTAAALTAVTETLEFMVAVRPTFHNPALLAKQAANIDHIGGGGRLSLNVVSSWWKDEAEKYGIPFEQHDDRYARTEEWLEVVDSLWQRDGVQFNGKYYRVRDSVLQPKPISKPRPTIYAGGESEAAKNLIAQKCDAYVMHGDPPERIGAKIADMRARRERFGLPPMTYGIAGYGIVRNSEAEAQAEKSRITNVQASAAGYDNYQQWLAGTQLDQRVSLEDYSVSNRGLRSGFVGTPQQVLDRVAEFKAVGVNLLLLQFSPQLEEMERFSESVITPMNGER
jgi:dimethylsulfone monooxygenase